MKQLEEAKVPDNRSMLSPIPESNSSKYDTIDSHADPNYARRFDPNDERPIKGSGTYKYDPNDDRAFQSSGKYNLPPMDEDEDYDAYSDDFESDEDTTDTAAAGSSGSTAYYQANINVADEKQLEEVVEAYRQVLEESMNTDLSNNTFY